VFAKNTAFAAGNVPRLAAFRLTGTTWHGKITPWCNSYLSQAQALVAWQQLWRVPAPVGRYACLNVRP
jgi:hypothetical protein